MGDNNITGGFQSICPGGKLVLALLTIGPSFGCPGTQPHPPDDFIDPVCAPEVSAVSGDAVDVAFPEYQAWYATVQPARLALELTWLDGEAFPGLEAIDVGVVVPTDPTVFTATFAEASGCVTRSYAVDHVTFATIPGGTRWSGDSWVYFDDGQVARWRAAVASPPLDGTSLDSRWRDLLAGAGLLILSQAPTLVLQFDGTPSAGTVQIFAAPAGDEGHQVPLGVATGSYETQ